MATLTDIEIEVLDPGIPEEGEPGLDILNIGTGDIQFRYNTGDPEEVEKAKRTIEDMLRRGYTILVEVKGGLRKVKKFDAKRELYIIQDAPSPEELEAQPKGVPLREAKATGIAPIAGG